MPGKEIEVSIILTALDRSKTVFDGVGESLRRLKAEFGDGDSLFNGSVKDAKQLVDLQSAIAREEKAAAQSKAAVLDIQTKLLQQEKALEQAISAETNAKKADIQLEREKLRLMEAQKKVASQPQKDVLKTNAFGDIKRMEEERARWTKAVNDEITRSDRSVANIKKLEYRQSTDDAIRSLKNLLSESKKTASETKSAFSSAFSGGLFGGALGALIPSAAQIVGNIPQQISEAFNKGLQFQQTEIALANITGSMDRAKNKISELVGVARDTAGLSFGSAVVGQTRLEAVGFEASKATELLKGMANVRILSGSTKQDFDAVLYNLTQIRAAGKLTGDELRETLMRMPYFAKVAKDAFGTIDTKAIADLGLSSDQFFDRLIKTLQGVPPAANDAGLAFENLSDATERLQTNVGTIISTNPELIALTRTLTGEIDKAASSYTLADSSASGFTSSLEGSTTSVDNAGSSLKRSTSSLSKFILELEVFGGRFDAVMKTVMLRADYMGQATRTAASLVGQFIYEIVDGIIGLVNKGIDGINFLVAGAKTLPTVVTGGAIQAIPTIGQLRRPESAFGSFGDILQNDRRNIIKNDLDVRDIWTNTNGEIKKLRENFDKYYNETVKGQRDLAKLRNDAGKATGIGDKRGGGDSDSKSKKGTDYLKDLQQLAIDSGFVPGSGYRKEVINKGSLHGDRRALDVSVKQNPGKTIEDYTRYIIAGIEKGYRAIDERVVGFHKGIRSTGPNVHLEKGSGKRESLFLPQSYYSVPVEYLKQLDEKRRGKGAGGYTSDDIERFNAKQSESITKTERDRITRLLVENYRRLGILPDDDLIRDFNSLLTDEAKKTGKIQPSFEQTKKDYFTQFGFKALDDKPAAEITTRPLDRRSQRFLDLNGSLDIGKRQTELDERRLFLADEILVRAEDYRLSLQEALTESQVEYAVLLKRNIAIESSVEFEKQRNSQIREIGDIERDLTVFRAQNADAEFVAQRRNLEVKREQFGLEREIASLRDQIFNGGKNDALEIEAAHLRNIVDLRREELEAIISINRSQLELAEKSELSANKIRARVLEHLASQKTLNDALGDGIISAFDKAVNFLDKRLGKLGEIPIIGDLLKFGNQQFLSKITTGLLDTFLPDSGLAKNFSKSGNPTVDKLTETNSILKDIRTSLKSGGVGGIVNINGRSIGNSGVSGQSGIAGILSTIFGGGGGAGIGPGGTPNFNPFYQVGGATDVNGSRDFGTNFFRNSGSQSGILSIEQLLGGGAGETTRTNPLQLLLKGDFKGALKGITAPGGIFGEKGFGNNTGTYSAIGSATQFLGGLFGANSRFGRTISYAGQGLSLGATIGSIVPGIGTAIGAAVGAIAGGLFGLFSNPQRKKDEQLRSQFRDEAVAALNRLIPAAKNGDASALPQGEQVRTQYIDAVNTQLKDAKTKRIALNELNPPNIIYQRYEELKKAAQEGSANSDRSSRILPEFAEGGFMSDQFGAQFGDFKRRYGILKGGIPGKDSIPTLAMEGEMFLTKNHQERIRRIAGYDIFQDIDLPNYPRRPASSQIQRFAEGGVVGNVSSSFAGKSGGLNFTVNLHNVTVNEDSYMSIETEDKLTEFVNLWDKAVTKTLIRRSDLPVK